MKKGIISLVVLLALISITTAFDSNGTGYSSYNDDPPSIDVFVYGDGFANANVRCRNKTTEVDYYAFYLGFNYYRALVPFGEYDVFVCSSYPSLGADYDVLVEPNKWGNHGKAIINLEVGECIYGD